MTHPANGTKLGIIVSDEIGVISGDEIGCIKGIDGVALVSPDPIQL